MSYSVSQSLSNLTCQVSLPTWTQESYKLVLTKQSLPCKTLSQSLTRITCLNHLIFALTINHSTRSLLQRDSELSVVETFRLREVSSSKRKKLKSKYLIFLFFIVIMEKDSIMLKDFLESSRIVIILEYSAQKLCNI